MHSSNSSDFSTIKVLLYTVKALVVKKFGGFGKLQQFAKFFANFHYFHNISYANDLQFNKVFSAKLLTILNRDASILPAKLLEK